MSSASLFDGPNGDSRLRSIGILHAGRATRFAAMGLRVRPRPLRLQLSGTRALQSDGGDVGRIIRRTHAKLVGKTYYVDIS